MWNRCRRRRRDECRQPGRTSVKWIYTGPPGRFAYDFKALILNKFPNWHPNCMSPRVSPSLHRHGIAIITIEVGVENEDHSGKAWSGSPGPERGAGWTSHVALASLVLQGGEVSHHGNDGDSENLYALTHPLAVGVPTSQKKRRPKGRRVSKTIALMKSRWLAESY